MFMCDCLIFFVCQVILERCTKVEAQHWSWLTAFFQTITLSVRDYCGVVCAPSVENQQLRLVHFCGFAHITRYAVRNCACHLV